mmetsp:Transcript_2664/g.4896  ORF Transcript_2664/g.4896 Transcript_2664/m.4896 type:complete len:82 (-) Transcript_2664:568-813(-)
MNFQKVLHCYLHSKIPILQITLCFYWCFSLQIPVFLAILSSRILKQVAGAWLRHENTNPPRLTTHPEHVHPDIQSLAPVSS